MYDTSYKFSYPCKVISNFVYDYYEINNYDKIKNIIFRKNKITTKKEKIYFNLFKLFINIFNLPISFDFQKYLKNFKNIFNIKLFSKEFLIFTRKLSKNNKNIFENLSDYIFIMRKLNYLESFFLYLFLNIRFNGVFKSSISFPIFSKLIKNKKQILSKHFLLSYFNLNYTKNSIDLKNNFIKFIISKKKILNNLGIKHIYLFGSILQNTYHENSDFDLLIEYVNASTHTNKYLNYIIKKKFNRNIDIHNINKINNLKLKIRKKKIF